MHMQIDLSQLLFALEWPTFPWYKKLGYYMLGFILMIWKPLFALLLIVACVKFVFGL